MRRSSFAVAVALFVAGATFAPAQIRQTGRVITPSSNIASLTDAGQQSNTNIEILSVDFTGAPQTVGPPFSGYFYNTPASLACVYNLVPSYFSPQCNPNSSLPNVTGGSKAIGIVDAYDNPNAFADLQAFSTQFGLTPITPSSFQVVYAPKGATPFGTCNGPATKPPTDPGGGGWEIEESLDVQYAHGMAPGATLYLVEAQSNSFADLYCAVSVANSLVASAGGGEISMSWGSGEFSSEVSIDKVFTTPGVVYFASTGDGPGTSYPSSSPNVVAVGGTTLSRNAVSGSFENENVWQDTGGGPSRYEKVPLYQQGIVTVRSTPDVAADANPSTGVWVLDNFSGAGTPCPGPSACWYVVGGTSLSSPLWAGIVNASQTFAASTNAEQIELYGNRSTSFTDITLGSCGVYGGFFAGLGWDYCSGNGSPNGYQRSR
jgi:subtilase family serine protease